MPPAKKTSSAQNTTLQSMGMDVIKQYPGPLTVSRAVKVDVPGKLPAAHLRQIVKVHNNWKYLCLRPTQEAITARYMLKLGNISAPSAAPPSTSPDPSSSDAAASAAPSSGSAGPSTSGHAADPPSADPLGGADMSLLQRAGVLQNTPYAA